ncbi:52 kDa repressor of the inhibitor of the protein kinase-like [Stegodyphus dumicola]|uniref:52 kDa repressor of the inhibitor of the protein kinase-like n=1 Tax=Stegodyphus dumicola TaxID=202533 RepID=UPI0015B17AF4|nr:52 kDa repressor of the inhibitor of the protein kinase-like [Stegodyphus dumicola]
MHEACKNHFSDQWHRACVIAAKNFLENEPVNVRLVSEHKKVMGENQNVIASIISKISFCGTHDLSLRAKTKQEGNNQDLISLKIEAGDKSLQRHFEKGSNNATYKSPQIQNELINLCELVVKATTVRGSRKDSAYSIMADKTSDISGKEQLIGIRIFDEERMAAQEEFLGFIELNSIDCSYCST